MGCAWHLGVARCSQSSCTEVHSDCCAPGAPDLTALASILIPGVGLIVGGGALATALIGAAGATVAGAAAGGVVGYLKDQGVPEEESQRFSNVYEQGGAILNVSAPSGDIDGASIETILNKYGEAGAEIWKTDPILEPVPPTTPV